MTTTWPGGAPSKAALAQKGVAGFYVDGTLNELKVKSSGSGATISCKVSMLLADFPDKSVFGFLNGGASVNQYNSYAAFFWEVYNRVAEKSGTRWTSAEGRHKARLLQLLCVAREGMDVESLSELMGQWGEPLFLDDCRDRVEEMSQWLLEPSPAHAEHQCAWPDGHKPWRESVHWGG